MAFIRMHVGYRNGLISSVTKDGRGGHANTALSIFCVTNPWQHITHQGSQTTHRPPFPRLLQSQRAGIKAFCRTHRVDVSHATLRFSGLQSSQLVVSNLLLPTLMSVLTLISSTLSGGVIGDSTKSSTWTSAAAGFGAISYVSIPNSIWAAEQRTLQLALEGATRCAFP